MLFGITLMILWAQVAAHGSMDEPPQRSSMWRFGFGTPANYNDMGLFCGGYANYWKYGGRCGACGDPYQGPRENEAGGKYATGTIARKYTKGQLIPVVIRLTAYHMGYFEFHLCAHNDVKTPVDPSCFDKTILKIQSSNHPSGTRFYPSGARTYRLKVYLPDAVTCQQCILRWKYRSGNNWGSSPEEGSCLGCGPQEHFINCADIAITGANEPPEVDRTTTTELPPVTSEKHTTKVATSATSTTTTTSATTTSTATTTTPATTSTPTTTTTTSVPTTARATTSETSVSTTSAPGSSGSVMVCQGEGVYRFVPGIKQWCYANCPQYCPTSHCRCTFT